MLTACSDNAGFIAAGLFAQVITVLPRKEAETLLHCLPKEKLTGQNKTAMGELTDMVIKNKKPPQGSPFEKIIPFTWQLMHTADDKIETLNSEAFTLTEKYLTALAENYR